jgi:hydrogenase expression/formation protein HypD
LKFIDEYRDPGKARAILASIHHLAKKPIQLMEVCGTHTVSIARFGLRQILPESIQLISGPGCPVCVTSNADLDRAISIAKNPEVTVATFGDMIRVPGSDSSLEKERAAGRDIRVVYSPLDALKIAEENPERKIVFLGVGFETTAPTIAATILEARSRKIKNFFVLPLHKTLPKALRALLNLGEIHLDGFLLPGHVSAIIGSHPYEFLAEEFELAGVISGFEPIDILQSILMLVKQKEESSPRIEIQYTRGVSTEGNPRARELLAQIFEPTDAEWRGLGVIPETGLALRTDFSAFDVGKNFTFPPFSKKESSECQCGEVLRGLIFPSQCPLFANLCTPRNPMGPCMVSSEGTCAAAYKYRPERRLSN